MDDIVVLILTLLVVAFGVIGQIKKKRPVQPDTNQDNNSGNFWDLFQVEPGFVDQPEEFNTPGDSPETNEIITEQPEYKFTPSNEGEANIYKEDNESLEEKKNEKILDDNFSLRKAIIYSEIINRKYT